ncbi:MAG: hypothetical protein PUC40_05385 [Lachnospiraceae bacterium]|nr:hypothetical protein [Lachnospiraceae bacterium]
MMEPYENLANAIVLFAARDYRSALKRLKKNPGGKESMRTAMKCEQFFRSGWYSALSNVSGEYLIEQLQKEVREA